MTVAKSETCLDWMKEKLCYDYYPSKAVILPLPVFLHYPNTTWYAALCAHAKLSSEFRGSSIHVDSALPETTSGTGRSLGLNPILGLDLKTVS